MEKSKLKTIVISTANKGKLKEFQDSFAERSIRNIEFRSIDQVIPTSFDVDETGSSFVANAILKAEAAAHMFGEQSNINLHEDLGSVFFLADDSGIEIDALNGAPGIYSGRFLRGEPLPEAAISKFGDIVRYEQKDSGNQDLDLGAATQYKDIFFDVLSKVQEGQSRKCRFVCSLVLANINGEIIFQTEQYWNGNLALSPRGVYGFGYDPIVIPDTYDQTVAELGDKIKNKLSHRAQALDKLSEFLQSN